MFSDTGVHPCHSIEFLTFFFPDITPKVVNACMLRLLLPLLSVSHSLLVGSEALLQGAADCCARLARCTDQVDLANYWRQQYAALRARSAGATVESQDTQDNLPQPTPF